jgi:hypothetical protein
MVSHGTAQAPSGLSAAVCACALLQVALSQPYGAEADVFSFATILWQIIAHQRPFSGARCRTPRARTCKGWAARRTPHAACACNGSAARRTLEHLIMACSGDEQQSLIVGHTYDKVAPPHSPRASGCASPRHVHVP